MITFAKQSSIKISFVALLHGGNLKKYLNQNF
jgi:hypothetical protein